MDVCIMRCGRGMSLIKSQLGMIPNLLVVVSKKPDIVSCGGAPVDVLKPLDKMSSSKIGLQYLFNIHELQFEKLLRNASYNVIGRVDMFALLDLLLPRIVDRLDFKWLRTTPLFVQGSLGNCRDLRF